MLKNRFRKSPAGRAAINRSISADPNLNDPEIAAKIGNRMTKTVEKSIGSDVTAIQFFIFVLRNIFCPLFSSNSQ
jgi:hypothetical protein